MKCGKAQFPAEKTGLLGKQIKVLYFQEENIYQVFTQLVFF